ncbi:hypothetical protein NC653_033665 [Populus alba x Populus x berolinensis]|uniref:Uncharacterized protein n=1 Tax=Populus alba x Populus x berolinensis TaxID=444605 RepID=A0AAD6PZE6_9ROSI|nr:hypothetical protein NC653_033665 [Populus alba x Populus x berolinensis]
MVRAILLAFHFRLRVNGDVIVVKNAMAARDIAIFSNTLDISGNLLLINCETRREQKGKVFVVMEVEKKVVYMMDVMLEVVVATFLRPCYQNTEVAFLGFEMFG